MNPTKPIKVTQVVQATALSSNGPSGVEGAGWLARTDVGLKALRADMREPPKSAELLDGNAT
jgi:hypothetical protein